MTNDSLETLQSIYIIELRPRFPDCTYPPTRIKRRKSSLAPLLLNLHVRVVRFFWNWLCVCVCVDESISVEEIRLYSFGSTKSFRDLFLTNIYHNLLLITFMLILFRMEDKFVTNDVVRTK